MASVIGKKKGNQIYYYVVESARVQGKPRIVSQAYLGTADKLAALIKDRAAPLPVAASSFDYGLPGALWLAARQTGVLAVLEQLWPVPRSGPSTAHYLLLAAIHRVCRPGPKTEVADWYQRTVLENLWRFPPERFTSQAFWDCFDRIRTGEDAQPDDLQEAQMRLLACWKDQKLVSRRLLAYDTTNFHTYIASTNERNQLAQRGHNKQGRHHLRQVGLSYVLDSENGLGLCHHVYPGNVPDALELPVALERIGRMLDRNGIERETVTLVFDKGSAALENTLLLEQARVGWISALPWNQAPEALRGQPVDQLSACASLPGLRVATETHLVHGRDYRCVLVYSSPFAAEQLHSLTTTLGKILPNLRRLAAELSRPGCRLKSEQVQRRIERWLSAPLVRDLITWQLEDRGTGLRLQFDFNNEAFHRIMTQRLGRTVLLTNRLDWSGEQVAAGYAGQQRLEQVFRGLKEGDWLGWGPMHHWTDSKIRIHAFCCILGISLLNYVHQQAQSAWPGITVEQLKEELAQIQQFLLLYPPQGEKGPYRAARVLSKQTLTQQALLKALHLDQLVLPNRG
jgi:transposase